MPVVWYGSEEQKKKWIGEATSDPTHSYLAGWTVSEPAGPQSGTANFDHPGAHPAGIGVIAELDKGRGEWVLNGRKKWPCNSGGWDLKGANVNIVIVRTAPKKGGKHGLSGMLVPRGAPGVRYEQPISKIGHRLCQNNTIVFENFAECRRKTSSQRATATSSSPRISLGQARSPRLPPSGVARSAYEYILKWAKSTSHGSDRPIMHYQAVGYKLASIAMKIEACRAFAWKAAHYLDLHDSGDMRCRSHVKVYCSETMFQAVFERYR